MQKGATAPFFGVSRGASLGEPTVREDIAIRALADTAAASLSTAAQFCSRSNSTMLAVE